MDIVTGNSHSVTQGLKCPGVTGTGSLASYQRSISRIGALPLIPVDIADMVYEIIIGSADLRVIIHTVGNIVGCKISDSLSYCI